MNGGYVREKQQASLASQVRDFIPTKMFCSQEQSPETRELRNKRNINQGLVKHEGSSGLGGTIALSARLTDSKAAKVLGEMSVCVCAPSICTNYENSPGRNQEFSSKEPSSWAPESLVVAIGKMARPVKSEAQCRSTTVRHCVFVGWQLGRSAVALSMFIHIYIYIDIHIYIYIYIYTKPNRCCCKNMDRRFELVRFLGGWFRRETNR